MSQPYRVPQPPASPIGSLLPLRRHLRLGAGAGRLPAACGSSSDGDDSVQPTAAGESGGAFPVAIEHSFGELALEQHPERVVIVGFKGSDAFLALGLVPVAVREWFGEKPNAVWPWATEYLKGAELWNGALQFSSVLSLGLVRRTGAPDRVRRRRRPVHQARVGS